MKVVSSGQGNQAIFALQGPMTSIGGDDVRLRTMDGVHYADGLVPYAVGEKVILRTSIREADMNNGDTATFSPSAVSSQAIGAKTTRSVRSVCTCSRTAWSISTRS
jgi:hypothetical protein